MKKILLAFAISALCAGLIYYVLNESKNAETRVQVVQFLAPSLQGNVMGEDSNRLIYVYLPPDYEQSNKRYPCIYYLHGFTSNQQEYITLKLDQLMDEAIKRGLIAPCILVVPGSYTTYKGSFYSNTEYGGKWADYIAKDVVRIIDSRYRTIADRSARGISGHSMGGNGALKLAFEYPEVFGSVYALSPSVLNWAADFSENNPSFKLISSAKDYEAIKNDFYSTVLLAMGRAYSDDTAAKPFKCRMPYVFVNGVRTTDSATLEKWNDNMLNRQLGRYFKNSKTELTIGFENGMEDEYTHIPITCRQLDSSLTAMGIRHEYNTYHGQHFDQIPGKSGRLFNYMIPFFGQHLKAQ